MAASTITIPSNQTVTFDATSSTLNSTIDFTGTSGNLELTNLSASNPLALTITGNFGANISNVLTFGTADNVSVANSKVTITAKPNQNTIINLADANNNALGTITVAGDPWGLIPASYPNATITGMSFRVIATPRTDGSVTVCFLADSMIATPKGTVAVQDLHEGDEVLTYANGVASVSTLSWAGMAHCTVNPALPDDMAGYPVRILANAIADGVPYKDMLLTAEHCLFFNGMFIPTRMLVNGSSIFYDKSITSYNYYHIETPDHAVIMADGMLTESYLDTGNRRSFTQQGNVIQLGGAAKSWQDNAAAPLCADWDAAKTIFTQIAARAPQGAYTAPHTTHVPELHLVTERGATIWPANCKNDTYNFILPANTQAVRIVSRASRPADAIGPFVDDRRTLGVAVADINVLSASKWQAVTAHLQADKPEGWHATDWTDCAWTNGNAALPLPAQHTQGAICMLSVKIRAAGPYLLGDTAQDEVAKTA
ncbi:Hint domain-containing protein [Acetobacter pasteurianus]|uniref:Hint domain-containing protein n=1 Tax=Acetobacter pasteurianus TaxID=438 RepID=UPI0013634758|nr:Hint domain-containing protein [Acetobacter pasteurianus]QHM91061.1 Hint domain-containing protein [Acetobacter pasteurianus]